MLFPDSNKDSFFDVLTSRLGLDLSQPSIILVGGFAGSGKTHMADILTGGIVRRDRPAVVLDKDTMCRPLLEYGLQATGGSPHDRESDMYVSQLRPLEYECLMGCAYNNAAVGVHSIISAPFILELQDPEWLKGFQAQTSALDVQTSFLWINCDPEIAKKRVITRAAPRDTWKLANWDKYIYSLPWAYKEQPKISLPSLVVYDNTNDLNVFGFDESPDL